MPVSNRDPSPEEEEKPTDPYNFNESDHNDEEVAPSATDNLGRSTMDSIIPPFWGVVRVGGVTTGQREYERDNSMRHMLSGNVYYSRQSNTVFAGLSAIEALEFEKRNDEAFSPFTRSHNNQVYVRAP